MALPQARLSAHRNGTEHRAEAALIGGIAATSAKRTESLGALTDDLRELARLQRYEIRADRRWHLALDDLHREVFDGIIDLKDVTR